MNENEIGRIAASIAMLRPDWPASSIRSLLQRPELAARPRRDVAVALAWVACESTTQTPARVLEAGPWWKATSIDGGNALRPAFDPREVCAICSEREATCRARYSVEDHEFRSVERNRGVRSAPRPEAFVVVPDKGDLCRHGTARDRCAEHKPEADPTPVEAARGVPSTPRPDDFATDQHQTATTEETADAE